MEIYRILQEINWLFRLVQVLPLIKVIEILMEIEVFITMVVIIIQWVIIQHFSHLSLQLAVGSNFPVQI